MVFEDVCPEIMRGQVLKPLERGNMMRAMQNDPLPGRIRYRAADHSEVEVNIVRTLTINIISCYIKDIIIFKMIYLNLIFLIPGAFR